MKKLLIIALVLFIFSLVYSQPAPMRTVFFWQLVDTPTTLSGQGDKYVKVNVGGTALEFTTLSGGGDMTRAVYDSDSDSLIDQAAGGTELDTSGVTDGQLLIGTTASNVWALGTITEGLAIDITNGGGSITAAFDPTELLGSRTWGDASTDTIVWTWNRATGTDPTMTFGNGLISLNGAFSLSTYLDITPTANQAHSEGRMFYDSDVDTFVMYNAESDVSLNVGEENWVFVRNSTGSTITDGQVVYFSGATGGRPNIILAKADATATSFVVGIATHDIENNTDGYITVFGVVRGGVNTTGLAGGDPLYLSAATAGALTTTPPTPPDFIVMVARVMTVGANGDVFVCPQLDYTDGVVVNTLATVGDITILGDDLYMTTNTNRFVLIGDGTNYNPEALDLGTDTTGNYVATIADAGNSRVTVANSGAESAAVTLDLTANGVDDTIIDWGTGANQVAAADIPMAVISGSTYSTVQEMQNIFHSAGWVSGGGITDDTDGTITVAAGTGLIRASNSTVAEIVFFDWAAESGANVNLADTDTSYVYAEYNAGTPRVVATTTERTDFHTNVLLAILYRDGTDLHINPADKHSVGDHANNMIRRLIDTATYGRKSGGILSETGTRNIAITAGDFWKGLTEFSTSAVDTSGAPTFSYYHLTGSWQKVAAQSQIDNTQYSNSGVGLATLSNNKYGVHWVYIEADDDDIAVLYGIGDYTLAQSEDVQPPSSVPEHLQVEGILAGKIIIKKSDSAFTQIESAFQTTFQGSLATDHGSLAGLADTADHAYALLIDGTRDLAGAWNMASQATTNVNIDSGTIDHEAGGLEADVSGYSGLLAVSGGSTSEVDTFAEIDTQIADKTLVNEEDAVTWDSTSTHAANLDIDDGVGDSPFAIWRAQDNQNISIYKANAGDALITATSGAIQVRPSGDVDDYIKFSTAAHIVTLETIAGGDGDLVIKAAGGDISFDDDNLTTTGTIEGATITEGGVGVPNTNDNLSVFAATTSAQLKGILSDETGSNLAVFSDTPTLLSPSFNTGSTMVYQHDSLFPITKIVRRRDGTPTSDVSSGDILGRIAFHGYHTAADYTGAYLQAVVDNTPGNSDMPSRVEFYTSADASATPTLRMTIDSAGDVELGADDNKVDLTIHSAGILQLFDDSDDTSVSMAVNDGTTVLAITGSIDVSADVEAAVVTLVGADANPAAAGEVRYDSTVSGMSGGALRWYDDDSVRILVDLETDPSSDDYVVTYDAAADGFYMKANTSTRRLSIMGSGTMPDATGECYMAPIDVEVSTIATFLGSNLVMVLKDPSADTGFYGSFEVPPNYVSTPVIAITGILDGTVGATSVDFEFSYLTRVDNETIEAAWEESVTFDTGNTNGWANEDILTDSAACSANFTAGDTVFYYFKRDFGTDDFSGDFHIIHLHFQFLGK